MHAFFLTVRLPVSRLEQPWLTLVREVRRFLVSLATHARALLKRGPLLGMLDTAPGSSRRDRLAGRRTRKLTTVLRLAVVSDPAAELVRVEAAGAADLVAGQLSASRRLHLARRARCVSRRARRDRQAERLFELSRENYRGVSPIPVALLDFHRGRTWMAHGDLHRARAWFTDAHRRLPSHVAAQGHLGEVEAMLGRHEVAIALLRPLGESVEDPDYAAALSRILRAAGYTDEAEAWRADVARRYDALLARDPDAFADHAAEFLLRTGGDPQRALALARRNLELRPTPRAQRLFTRAAAAANRVSAEDISR
jgi:tetratricopeptide (TPR) repeat protein